jgi:hypothetical protein
MAPTDEVELSVEREILDGRSGTPRRVRLVVRLRPAGPDQPVLPEQLASAVSELNRLLDAAVGDGTAPAPASLPERHDRSFEELVEAYHPRQVELIDLLRDEGELTPSEHEMLSRYLTTPTAAAVPPPAPSSARSLAEAPLDRDHAPSSPRPVRELLDRFQIASLKQAGAVRARRQISYEEYMALKRHFAGDPAAAPSV